MRTKSITYIIKKYGLRSKRLYPKVAMKYEEALERLKKYSNEEFEVKRVVDNVWHPQESVSDHCQLDGCGRKIRYEYHVANKKTGKEIIVGSTCVCILMGFSELERKEFLSIDGVIRERAELKDWVRDNTDVVEALRWLKSHEVWLYRPYWEEIEHTKLLDEDSEFIRNNIEKEKSFYEKRMAKEKEIKAKEEAERKKQAGVIEKLEALLVKEPMNWFYQSLKNQIGNRVLSDKQVWCVERDYQKKIVCA